MSYRNHLTGVFVRGLVRGIAAPALIFSVTPARALQHVDPVEVPVKPDIAKTFAADGGTIMHAFDSVMRRGG